ncbi:MAG TPA: carbohydrate kinase family protein [Candidatus Magasanikbacteria bacterium]|nr:carbohydrate kinase family protein [Candidatus Magasanikbacteria bacterium]
MYDIITIGDATLDTFLIIDEATVLCDLERDNCKLCINYADKIPIRKTFQSVGGNAANVAIGCQRAGLSCAIVTELGDDLNGYMVREELQKNKVMDKFVKVIKNGETRYAVVLNYRGERTILSYYSKRNYSLPKLPATKFIYYSSLGETFEKVQHKLIAHLKKNPETKLAVNPGSYQSRNGLKEFKKILPYTSILFANREEAARIIGKPDADSTSLARDLHNMGVKTVAITDGANGSLALDANMTVKLKSYPTEIIDKTGAGDAYAVGFISAILRGHGLDEAVSWGTANSTSVISKLGAQAGLLSHKEILKVVEKNKGIVPEVL